MTQIRRKKNYADISLVTLSHLSYYLNNTIAVILKKYDSILSLQIQK